MCALFSELDSSLDLDYSSFVSGLGKASGAARTFGSTTEDAFDDADDEMDSASRSASGLSRAMGSLGSAAGAAVGPINIFASSVDEAGDEASEAGMEAAGAATGFAALSASGEGLRLSLGAISGNLTTVAVGITAVLAALSPLVPVLGLAAGATLGLAAAFGAILGTGILAFGEKRASQNAKQLKQVNSKIDKLESLKDTEKGLTKAQETQLESLKEQAKTLEEGSTAAGGLASAFKDVWTELKPVIVAFGQQFVPLIESAISALPGFVKGLLNAVGNLDPFVKALQALGSAAASILPKLLKLFVDVARTALPAFHDIGNFLASNLVPALDSLFQAGQRAAGPVLRLGLAIADLVTALAPAFGLLGRAALAMYDLAAGALRAGAALTTNFINGLRQGIGTLSRWATVISGAVLPVLSQLGGAWASMGGRVASVAAIMGAAIQGRFLRVVQSAATQVRALLTQMSVWWAAHGASVVATINQFSTHAQEAVIQMMAAISSAFQGAGESEASFGYFFMESLREMLAAARVIGAQLPLPIQSAMALIASAVRTNIAQVRTAITAARGVWTQHGAAVRRFATTAVAALQQFAGMVRTAISKPLATFARLRTELNAMLPPFLRIKTTARDVGSVIQSTLLPALAASGLLGIAATLTPILSRLAGVFGGLRGIAMRVAAIFGGPVIAGLRVVLGPLTSLAGIVGRLLLPALTTLAGLLAGPVISALLPLAGLFNPITIAIGAVVGALYLLGAASKKQLAKFGRMMGNIARVVKSALTTAWNWVSTAGVKLAATALGALATGAIRAFKFGKEHLLPTIQRGVRRAWNWVKTAGVQLATQALRALGTRAVAAFKFGKNNLLPKIQQALRGAWNWVKGPGVQMAIQALNTLGRLAVAAFKFTKAQILPKIQSALRGAWNWVKGPGVQIASAALKALGRLSVAAWNFGKAQLLPKIRTGIGGVASWIKTKGLSLFKAAFRSIGPNIGNAVTGWITIITKAFKNGIPMIRNWLRNNGANIIKGGFKAIGRGIRSTVLTMLGIAGMVGQAVKSTITGIGNWLKSGGATRLKNSFKKIISGIVSYLKNDALGDLKGAAEFVFDGIMAAAEGLYEGLIGGSLIPDMFDDIASFIRTFDLFSAADALLKSVWKRFDKFATDAFNVVKNGVGAIAQWLRNGAGNLAGAAKSAAKTAAEALKKAFNNALPDKISIPKISVGGGKVAGVKVPKKSIGGQSLKVPKLAKGGEIKAAGLAMVHAGEEVVPAADVRSRDSGQSTTGSNQSPNKVVLQLDGDAVTDLMRGEAVEVVESKEDSIEFSTKRGRTSRFSESGG